MAESSSRSLNSSPAKWLIFCTARQSAWRELHAQRGVWSGRATPFLKQNYPFRFTLIKHAFAELHPVPASVSPPRTSIGPTGANWPITKTFSCRCTRISACILFSQKGRDFQCLGPMINNPDGFFHHKVMRSHQVSLEISDTPTIRRRKRCHSPVLFRAAFIKSDTLITILSVEKSRWTCPQLATAL